MRSTPAQPLKTMSAFANGVGREVQERSFTILSFINFPEHFWKVFVFPASITSWGWWIPTSSNPFITHWERNCFLLCLELNLDHILQDIPSHGLRDLVSLWLWTHKVLWPLTSQPVRHARFICPSQTLYLLCLFRMSHQGHPSTIMHHRKIKIISCKETKTSAYRIWSYSVRTRGF